MKCPYLIQEMVSCLSQLILLAHAGRIARLPSLDTVEATMKCSALVVQALWDKASPLQQLPHVEEDMLKHFYSKRRNIKSLKQLAMMADEDRRSLLRSVTDEQYKDLMKVLGCIPQLSMTITTEVIDDETQHVVTAGSIVTVTIRLTRKGLDMHLGSLGFGDSDDGEAEEKDADEMEDNIDDEEDENLDKELEEKEDEKEEEKKKGPVWKKPQQKKKAKKPGKQSGKPKQKAKTETPATPNAEAKEAGSGSESEGGEESGSEESGSEGDKERRPVSEQDDQDEEQE